MVQTDTPSNSGDESPISPQPAPPAEEPTPPPPNPSKGIPKGNYRIVGWGADTTGRRLIDELCQIAGYTPDSTFSQYIMPFNDVNPLYSRMHNIRIVNTRYYRRLKDVKTNQYVKTKSEMSALTDFLQWLETKKGDSDGLILVYHEMRKSAPGLLLESLRRYNLVDKFAQLVKGFANCFNIARTKCHNTTKAFNLRVLSKVLLNREDGIYSSAVERAHASYDILAHLAQSERLELDAQASGDCSNLEPHVIEFVCPWTDGIEAEEEEIAGLKVLLERQNTFKPVFGALLKANRFERQKAAHLRRLLAVNNLDYDQLQQAFEKNAKEGLEKLIKNEISNAKDNDLEDLLEILDCFFDPEKSPIVPKQRQGYNNNNNNTRPFRKNHRSSKTGNSDSPNVSSDLGNSLEDSPRVEEPQEAPITAPLEVA